MLSNADAEKFALQKSQKVCIDEDCNKILNPKTGNSINLPPADDVSISDMSNLAYRSCVVCTQPLWCDPLLQ